MFRRSVVLAAVIALVALLAPAPASAGEPGGAVVVANRGSGDITVIDTETLATQTFELPGIAEPMYVSHDSRHDRVLVGDRASSTIVAFDDETYEIVGSVTVGEGIFHQWLDVDRERLWVVGTSASTVSVVDSSDLSVVTTFSLPADVIAAGGIPHDVFVSNNRAFVSVVGLDSGDGLVIQYSTKNFAETGRITTGADPHLFVQANKLFVASQVGSSVSKYHATTLAPMGSITLPAAHGLFVTNRNQVFATNIAGGGANAVWQLDKQLDGVVDVANTPAPVPHNITVDNTDQVWVTHSGATADQVSVISIEGGGLGSVSSVTAGTNPFGLAFVD